VNRPSTSRHAWQEVITVEDYERHMAAVGQVQANASLLEELFRDYAPRLGAQILFAGAGTGQYLDYMPRNQLGLYRTTFADIKPANQARLAGRICAMDIATVLDDIEDSRLAGPFDLAIAILVLEHTDWRRAVDSLTRQAARVFTITQVNPPEATPNRLQGTMTALATVPPTPIDPAALTAAFEVRHFRCYRRTIREVSDGKTMLAMDFLPTENRSRESRSEAAER
jgi:hypothetical protein